MTFGFVGDRGSFVSQGQRDPGLRDRFLTARLTAPTGPMPLLPPQPVPDRLAV